MTSDKSEVVFYSEAMGNGICTYSFIYSEKTVCFSHCFEMHKTLYFTCARNLKNTVSCEVKALVCIEDMLVA